MRGVALSVLALAASASFAMAKDEADKPVFKVWMVSTTLGPHTYRSCTCSPLRLKHLSLNSSMMTGLTVGHLLRQRRRPPLVVRPSATSASGR